jgi:hypothetical protein
MILVKIFNYQLFIGKSIFSTRDESGRERYVGNTMESLLAQTPEQPSTFVDLVDFKWLMAGLGWWVDLSRLQHDMAYAGGCVERGLASGSNLLRERSAELLPLLARLGTDGSATLTRVSTGH